MTNRAYRGDTTLARIILNRYRNGTSLEAIRANLVMQFATEELFTREPLPLGWRPVLMGRDRVMIAAGNDFLRDADLYLIDYPLVSRKASPDSPPPMKPTDSPSSTPTPPTVSPIKSRQPTTTEEKSPADLTYDFLVGEGEKLRRRKKFYQDQCMTRFGVGSHIFHIQWQNACQEVGVPIYARAKRKRGKAQLKRKRGKAKSKRRSKQRYSTR